MHKRIILLCLLMIYGAILFRVMVLKDVPPIRVGHLILNFGGTETGHPANFVPFRTIVPYLLGYKGWIIAGINLFGNIGLLVPVGFLLACLQKLSWPKVLALGVISGLVIEGLQTILHVGIFDIDDMILNALGVMIGYYAAALLLRWILSKRK